MSANNYILNLLNIKDENIFISSNKLENKEIKGINYKIIEGILTYNPEFCPIFGVMNYSSNDIIKWGFKKIVKLKFLIYLIVSLYLFFINKDFIVNIAIILLLLKLI